MKSEVIRVLERFSDLEPERGFPSVIHTPREDSRKTVGQPLSVQSSGGKPGRMGHKGRSSKEGGKLSPDKNKVR